MYDDKGRLTRAGAVQIIQGGGSVLYAGQIYNSVEKLPSEADFAKGNPAAEADAKARLQKTIADAQQQLEALSVAAPPEAKTEPEPVHAKATKKHPHE